MSIQGRQFHESTNSHLVNNPIGDHGLPQPQALASQAQPQLLRLASASSLIQNHLSSQQVPTPIQQAFDAGTVQSSGMNVYVLGAHNAETGNVIVEDPVYGATQPNNAPNGSSAIVRPETFISPAQLSNGQPAQTNLNSDARQTPLIPQYLTSTETVCDIYADLPKPTPNTDPDNCFKCKNPGDFINCSSCEKPYHLFCADLERMPDRVWECFECQHISRERLIRNLKEKQRQKVRERELKREKDRLDREYAKKQREEEQKRRREINEKRKHDQKVAKIQQQELRKQQMAEQAAQIAEMRANQIVMGPDGKPVLASTLRQTTLKTEKRKRVKEPHVLTAAEREKIERNRMVKQQFQIFAQMYPEYVERNSVRYPIPDNLIAKMPELHGGVLRDKPKAMKIRMEAKEFERLLYIWEFCNNFSEFLETPSFKIEELAACLDYSTETDPRFQMSIEETEALDWTEQMEMRHINEKGFHMVNHLLTALAQCYLRDLFPDEQHQNGQTSQAAISSGGETQNQILASIDKLIDDKHKLWPEIIRLILAYTKSEDADVFGPFEDEVILIQKKLIGVKPAQFTFGFTKHEKVTLLTVLIDCIHETNEFRLFLNRRVEDKSSYNKEKMEVYQQIRDLETRQQEFIKTHAEDESTQTQEQMQEQINALTVQLQEASRLEARPIKEQISALKSQKTHYASQLAYFDDQIKKKQIQISRLNEKTYKSSIKTTILGKDSAKSEYWHFKDDNSRLYVRMEEEIALGGGDVQMAEEEITPERETLASSDQLQIAKKASAYLDGAQMANSQHELALITTAERPVSECAIIPESMQQPVSSGVRYSWYYYEREDQLEELLDCLNFKGQSERKLQENLRKVKDRLKLIKTKKAAIKVTEESQANAAATSEKPAEQTEEGAAVIKDANPTEGAVEVQNPNVVMADNETGHEGPAAGLEGTGTVEPKQVDISNEESKTVLEEPSRDQQKSVDNNTAKADQSGVDENLTVIEPEEAEVEDTVRRVMFETDNWSDSITEAVWFGQKIPQKRRMGGRMAANQKDPVKEFFEDFITHESCKLHLIEISDKYMRASCLHDREWEDEKVRETWEEAVRNVDKTVDLIPLINQLNAGMCLPTSLCARQGQNGEPGKIQRLKLQLFKFWPSQDIKAAWKTYLEQADSLESGNQNSLYITLKILEAACEQFSVRQAQKMERKNKQAIMQAVQQSTGQGRGNNNANMQQIVTSSALNDWTGRQQRAVNRQVVKYYESSESEDEDGSEGEEDDKDEKDEKDEKDADKKASAKEDQSMKEDDDQEESEEESDDNEDSSDEEIPVKKTAMRGRAAKVYAITKCRTKAKKMKALGKEKKKNLQPKRGRGRGRRALHNESEGDEEDDASNQESDQNKSSHSDAPHSESEEVSADEKSKANEPIEEEIEWDEYCYECQDGGNVMCCESCSNVAHYQCVGLRQPPKGDWWCKDCQAKKAQQQRKLATRGANTALSSSTKTASSNGVKGSGRQATLTSMIPKRSSRRAGK